MTDNSYHNQHIMEYTQCMEDSLMQVQAHYDGQFKAMAEALDALEQRITRLEAEVLHDGKKSPQVEAEIIVTKASLKKVRDAIMNMFR